MHIGSFDKTERGFEGRLHSLTLDAPLCLVPAEPGDSENAPDWRAHLGEDGDGLEVGAGWNRTGEKAGAYVAVQIDCPAFTQPIRANLFRSGDGGQHHLLWSRPVRRQARNRSDAQ